MLPNDSEVQAGLGTQEEASKPNRTPAQAGRKEVDQAMFRLRIALWSLLAVFAVSGLSAAAASAEGPFWHVGGEKLKQGSKGLKLQSKGPLVLRSEVTAKPENVKIVITCNTSTSEGTIEGQGPTRQGQDKGTVSYEQCKVETKPVIAECKVVEPIKTGQLKSHLAFATVQGSEQIVDLFEPSPTQQTEEKVFARINLKPCAGIAGVYPVTGSAVAQLAPQEVEGQEGSLFFPEEPITKIKHEGQEVSTGLFLGPLAAKFTGYYGARLQSGERYGVFRN